jgi:hypothetical protein
MSKVRISVCLFTLWMVCAMAQAAQADGYERLPAAGGTLLLGWDGDFSAAEKQRMRNWLATAAETVTLLHGSLPRPEIRIELEPNAANSAVPFARVLRRDPQGVRFYVNPARPETEFISDWTAYHELSHLFIPYPGKPDLWFSEGLASYYQNLLQLRAGLLTPAETREKLANGFQRGREDSDDADLSLRDLSSAMRERYAFMRVYWSGALYFLEADITLRRQSNGQTTLDDVLRQFGECCINMDQRWTGLLIAGEFDRLAETNLFVPLYQRYSASMSIPEFTSLLAAPEMDAILASQAAQPESTLE